MSQTIDAPRGTAVEADDGLVSQVEERLYDLADLERYTVITAALVQFN